MWVSAPVTEKTSGALNAALPAQAAAAAALEDDAFLQQTLQTVHAGLTTVHRSLGKAGIVYFPTQANFFLIHVGRSADEVFEQMLRKGVIIRSMTSYGYPDMIRVNVGLPHENQRLVKALCEVLSGEPIPPGDR